MKLDLILENIKNKYTMGLLEESHGLAESDIRRCKITINESIMSIRNMLVEEGTIVAVQQVLEEAWIGEILEAEAIVDRIAKAKRYKKTQDDIKAKRKEKRDAKNNPVKKEIAEKKSKIGYKAEKTIKKVVEKAKDINVKDIGKKVEKAVSNASDKLNDTKAAKKINNLAKGDKIIAGVAAAGTGVAAGNVINKLTDDTDLES